MLRLALSVVSILLAVLSARAATQPNIVFLLIDDLGYADCGFNGGTDIQTPTIDKLAKAGTILESHYVQPVCSPTRAALMTGRYATHTGVYTIVRPHATWGLPLQERTLAQALKDAGYNTSIVGKWHLGEFEPAYLPLARGFEHHYGHYFGMIDYFTHMRGQDLDWYRDGQQLKEEGYSTHLLSHEACRIIEAQDKAKPLFLYLPFNGIHSPHQVPESYVQPYAKLQGARRQLAGMLAAVDEGIAQIMASLEKSGLRENTLIIFSADNGGPPPGSNAPLKGFKGSIHEGGVRGAAFVNWPGHVPAGVTLKQPMHIVDWYPTLAKLAGASVEKSQPFDGRDVWPMLTQSAPSPHDAILSVQAPEIAAVRMGDWKLTLNARDSKGEEGDAGPKVQGERYALYNLATDISEKTDLAAQEPERVATMKAKLKELLAGAVTPGQLNNEAGALKPPAQGKGKAKAKGKPKA